MKKSLPVCKIAILLFACAMLFQGCLKDTATKTYTLYIPVYKTVSEVRAGIKSAAAVPVRNPGKIFVQGNYIFLNEIDKGVHIIDNRGIETIYPFKNNLFIGSQSAMFVFNTANPAQPVQLTQYAHMTFCDPVIADDNFAYVTLRTETICHGAENELDILNIQNLQTPWLVKSYRLTNPHGLAKSGNTLLVCDGAAGLKVFDVEDVNNLRLLQTVEGIDAHDVIAQNNNAIVVAKDGLYQYDYTNRSNVTLKSRISYVNIW